MTFAMNVRLIRMTAIVMIKRVIPIQTAATLLLAGAGGCMSVSGGSAAGPTTVLDGQPDMPRATQPAVVASSSDQPAPKRLPIAQTLSTTRTAGTSPSRAPGSQPSDVAALADRAGGPAGGFIVGAVGTASHADAFDRARHANDQAEQHPAQVAEVFAHVIADLNGDGFITVDEITAMKRAGLTEQQLLDRLRQSKAVFSATPRQQLYLRDRGIPESVVKLVAGSNSPSQ